MLYIYHLLTIVFLPIYLAVLLERILRGKEDRLRIFERLGFSRKCRPTGRLIWIHCASVGESMIALTIISHIKKLCPELNILLTTTTLSSAKIMEEKLPPDVIHQFVPIDHYFAVRCFLGHWQPSLGIFIESELWPCLISSSSKVCPLLLFNAKLSDKSFARWLTFKPFFQQIIQNFREVITQSPTDYDKFNKLGIQNIKLEDNLKFANTKLEVNQADLQQLLPYFQEKKIITFASTHAEDEQIILQTIQALKNKYSNIYFVLIPRHPQRSEKIISHCHELKMTYQLRSNEPAPILTNNVYIVDNFGELGLFYQLSYISFIGGTFKQGGHNIIEPAHFGNLIFFGPDITKIRDIAQKMLKNKMAIQVHNGEELINKIEYFLSEKGQQEAIIYQKNALDFASHHRQILEHYLAIIKKYLK